MARMVTNGPKLKSNLSFKEAKMENVLFAHKRFRDTMRTHNTDAVVLFVATMLKLSRFLEHVEYGP